MEKRKPHKLPQPCEQFIFGRGLEAVWTTPGYCLEFHLYRAKGVWLAFISHSVLYLIITKRT